MKTALTILITISVTLFSKSYAQDPIFTQPFAGNVNLNTALAGCDTKGRLTTNYRDQWSKLNGGGYQTASLYYYQYLTKLNAFGGIHIQKDVQVNTFFTSQFSGYYNQNIKIKNLLIRPSIELTYSQKYLNFKNLTLGNQIDPHAGFISGSSDQYQYKNYLSVSAGTIFYFRKALIGFSTYNINQPNQSLINNTVSILPIRYNLQASYQLDISKLAISPYAFYCFQNGFDQLTYGIDFMYNNKINLAFSTRSRDNVNFIIGYHHKWVGFNYSYDYTVSQLDNHLTGGTHEFALFFKFWNRGEHKNYQEIKSVFCR